MAGQEGRALVVCREACGVTRRHRRDEGGVKRKAADKRLRCGHAWREVKKGRFLGQKFLPGRKGLE